MNDKIDKLIGRMLHKVSDDNDNLQLHLDNDEIVEFEALGDCCSDSWVESIESPSNPEKIISFTEIEISPYSETDSKKRDKDDMDSVQYYFYKIITEKGSYLIEMRNNSNGYYGGWLE